MWLNNDQSKSAESESKAVATEETYDSGMALDSRRFRSCGVCIRRCDRGVGGMEDDPAVAIGGIGSPGGGPKNVFCILGLSNLQKRSRSSSHAKFVSEIASWASGNCARHLCVGAGNK